MSADYCNASKPSEMARIVFDKNKNYTPLNNIYRRYLGSELTFTAKIIFFRHLGFLCDLSRSDRK